MDWQAQVPELEDFQISNVQCSLPLKELGCGSYGRVVELMVGGVLCAGKMVHEIFSTILGSSTSEELREYSRRFLAECRLMSRLRHPHIVQFLGVCLLPEYNRWPTLVMEYLPFTMDGLLENRPNIPLWLKRSLLHDVAKGLAYLHNMQYRDPGVGSEPGPIVHRDLTARNVLVSSEMLAKIADFGVARVINKVRLSGRLTGNPGNYVYMPPEAQEESEISYNTKMDIYSFGVLTLFAVTQELPHKVKPAVYVDEEGRLAPRTELERRKEYFDKATDLLGERSPFLKLITHCLCNSPTERPTVDVILMELEAIRLSFPDPYKKLSRLDMVRLLDQLEADRDLLQADNKLLSDQLTQCMVGKEGSVIALMQDKDELKKRLEKKEDQLKAQEKQRLLEMKRLQGLCAQEEQQCARLEAHLREKVDSNQRLVESVHEKEGQIQFMRGRILGLQVDLAAVERELQEAKDKRQPVEQSAVLEAKDGEIQRLRREVDRMGTVMRCKGESSGLKVTLPMYWQKCQDALCAMERVQAVALHQRGSVKVCVSGGTATAGRGNQVAVYDTSAQRWGRLSVHLYSCCAMACLNGKPLLVGGYNEAQDEYTGKVVSWDQPSRSWRETLPPMPTPRGDASAVCYQHWVAVAGGCASTGCLSVVEVLDSTRQQWYTVEPLPVPAEGLQGALDGDRWYLLGGEGVLGKCKVAFSVSLPTLISEGLSHPGGASGAGEGGSVWRPLPETPLGCCGVVVVRRGVLLAVGGKDSQSQRRSGVYAYFPGTWEWLHVGDLPTARHSSTCCPTSESSFLVIGGSEAGGGRQRTDQAFVASS